MPTRKISPIIQQQIARFKQRAKTLKKESGLSHAEALDSVAREEGFGSWKALISESEGHQESSDGV